jgi:hypothetical protein
MILPAIFMILNKTINIVILPGSPSSTMCVREEAGSRSNQGPRGTRQNDDTYRLIEKDEYCLEDHVLPLAKLWK